MTDERKSIHGEWTSNLAFILAATGAAVGLGNIWKFPYIAGENGGGAFVLVYLICIALIGIPLLTAEILIGRRGRQNPADSMRNVAIESNQYPYWQFIGWMGIFAAFLILSYYSVIAGWALDYVYQAGMGHFIHATPQQINTLFVDLMDHPLKMMFWHSLIMISTVGVVALGVQKGLERAVRYLFPMMFALLLVIVGYSIESGSFGRGFAFLFHPNFHALTPNVVLIALGHAFFTLSLATGSIMMYGAYVPQSVSIPRAAIFIAVADTAIALIAGLAIFPIVFSHGLEPSAGPGLIFKTLPIAFGMMSYGRIFAVMFFIMLVFAAFTSTISLIEPMVALFIERLGMTRIKATVTSGSLIWLLGLGTVFSFNIWKHHTLFGLNFFNLLDYLTANIMLPLGGLLMANFAAWRMKQSITHDELRVSSGFFYRLWHFCLGIIAPIAIIVVFLNAVGVIKF